MKVYRVRLSIVEFHDVTADSKDEAERLILNGSLDPDETLDERNVNEVEVIKENKV